MSKATKHMPCCRQKGHLEPISLMKGAGHEAYCLLCVDRGWTCCCLTLGKYPLERVQKEEAAQIGELNSFGL